jgi:hypothetical protein
LANITLSLLHTFTVNKEASNVARSTLVVLGTIRHGNTGSAVPHLMSKTTCITINSRIHNKTSTFPCVTATSSDGPVTESLTDIISSITVCVGATVGI